MKSKKADSKILSIWWFVVLLIILAGIVGGAAIFSSSKIDIRVLEADILSERIIDCITNYGYIDENFFNDNFNLFKSCGISEEIINKSGSYYLNISIYNSNYESVFEKYYGNNAFVQECKVGAAMIEAKDFPRCIEKSVNLLNSNGQVLKLNIISGSNSEYRLE